MADVVAQNILISILRYTESEVVRRKISWLRTAATILKMALKKKGKPELVQATEECLEQLRKLEMFNWEVFESYKGGYFNLLDDQEYQTVLQLLAKLEDTKDRLLEIFIEGGYAEAGLFVVE